MKRTAHIMTITLLVLSLGPVCLAGDGLPEGRYTGTGHWHSQDGSQGTYETSYTIGNGELQIEFAYDQDGERQAGRYEVRISERPGGGFDLVDEKGEVTGEGFCVSSECLMSYMFPGGTVKQSLRLEDGALRTVGSKTIGGYRIYWTETLPSE